MNVHLTSCSKIYALNYSRFVKYKYGIRRGGFLEYKTQKILAELIDVILPSEENEDPTNFAPVNTQENALPQWRPH